MRYLKPHYYDKFVCTAGDCPDSCCAGWQIMIDETSLERYGMKRASSERDYAILLTGMKNVFTRTIGAVHF